MIQTYTAYFDQPIKTAAVKQYMEQNCVSFEEATNMLNYQQCVDFLLFVETTEEGPMSC